MAQRRKKVTRRRGASRAQSGGRPAVAWFLAGLFLGLAVSGIVLVKGLLPERAGKSESQAAASAQREAALIGESKDGTEKRGSRFDFFTVLPEMEVVVPEQQLATEAAPAGEAGTDSPTAAYILQAGSFRNLADADQLKARLALRGVQASIQVVTVNDTTWHRVRIGPVQGARRADELRRMLLEDDIDTLVLKDSS